MDVFPIPPAPIRAIGVRFSTSPTIVSINSSRPKQALGGGGGDSPGLLDESVRWQVRLAVEATNLDCVYTIVSTLTPG